ncbi:hypothetical protein LSAT2_006817, partial [Lamellibrachia satsuma]
LTVPNAVENLVVPTRTTSSLTVEWAAPTDGGGEGYTVKLEGDGAPPSQTPNKDATNATFTGLKAGTEYSVGVVTTSGGQQSTKVEDTFYTMPNAVENLVMPTRTTSSLTVEWAAPTDGGWEGYTVKLEGDGAPSPQTPNKDATTATFTGLTAGTEYTVEVVTTSGGQQSTKVEDTFYTKPNVPRTLHELSTTGQSLTVSWDAPSNGALTGYGVTLEGGDKSQNQTHGKGTRTAAFTGLTAGAVYSVRVVTVSGDQQSTAVKDIFYTVPNVAQNLSLLSRTLHSLTVKWDAPSVGGLTGYDVSLKGSSTLQTQTPDNTTTTMVFAGLAAGTEYTVGVDTVNGNQKSRTVDAKFVTKSFAYNGTVTIINHEYRETLADNSSEDYKKMAAKVAFEVRLAYSGSTMYRHIVAVTDIVFSKGSVKVDYKLELDTVSSTETLKEEMVNYIDDHSGFVSELQINPSSITYDGKQTPTKVLPAWLLVVLPSISCLVVIVLAVLLGVCLSRRNKRRRDTTNRCSTWQNNDENDRRWFGIGNLLWHKDESWLRQQSRNLERRQNVGRRSDPN